MQEGFGGADPALERAQVGEREVDRVADAGGRREVEGLREVTESAGGGDGDLTVVGPFPAGEEPEQRGLAGAVVADDADPLAGPDRTADAVQDDVGVVALGDLGQDDLGGGEWSTQGRSFRRANERDEPFRLASRE